MANARPVLILTHGDIRRLAAPADYRVAMEAGKRSSATFT